MEYLAGRDINEIIYNIIKLINSIYNLFEVTGLTSSDETQKDIAYILKL